MDKIPVMRMLGVCLTVIYSNPCVNVKLGFLVQEVPVAL